MATGEFERKVTLLCGGTEFAEATSRLHITRADCISAIADGGVAIGQLFRHLNILPDFELLAAGTLEAGAPLPPEAALSAATDGDADGGGGGGGAGDGDDDADVARFWRRYVLSGGADSRVHVWSVRSGSKVTTWQSRHAGVPSSVRWAPGSMMAASACTEGGCALWIPQIE